MYRRGHRRGGADPCACATRGQGAPAFMADGYARATGQARVAYVITGPASVASVMTPMGRPYSDSVPVLVLSSWCGRNGGTQGAVAHQMKDQRAAARNRRATGSEVALTAAPLAISVDRTGLEPNSPSGRAAIKTHLCGRSHSAGSRRPRPRSLGRSAQHEPRRSRPDQSAGAKAAGPRKSRCSSFGGGAVGVAKTPTRCWPLRRPRA